jgi:ribosome-associated translation inhibitor RaiA
VEETIMMPQVTFRGISPSPTIVDVVWKRAQKLGEFSPQLEGCHVVIDASSHGSQRRVSYRVSVHLTGGTNAETRTTRQAESDNLYVAMRDAFDAVRRQLAGRGKTPRVFGVSALEGLH